jgi:serine O-acetyltransferase
MAAISGLGHPLRASGLRWLQVASTLDRAFETTKTGAWSAMTTDDDPLWTRIRDEASSHAAQEPMLASFLYSSVLNHARFEDALSFLLASKLDSSTLTAVTLRDLVDNAFRAAPEICRAARADIEAVVSRDPACLGHSVPLLYFKGYHAIQSYRVGHYYWESQRKPLALYLQSRISEVFAVDIHPGAKLGKGLFFDHATSIVIGETTVIDDDFSMLHEVTLGGTGKVGGDRHPKIKKGVLIGAGAKVLGNVVIGEGAKIGAGSVVLTDVPPHCTVAGVPARPIGYPRHALPALEMDQSLESK